MKKTIDAEMNLILNKLKEERLKLGLSQWRFGQKIGLSQNAYYKLETGKTKLDIHRFLVICTILNLNPKSFF